MTSRAGDVRTRLQDAALELFRTHGYDRTTAAGIAARASVTERTFFRHFPDKREVLFAGETRVRAALTEAIVDAPVGPGPLDTLFQAFRSFEPMLQDSRAFMTLRQDIIAATPALHERELAKIAALADALAAALQARGFANLPAVLAAHIGMVAFVHATLAWLNDPDVGFGERIEVAAQELKTLVAESD